MPETVLTTQRQRPIQRHVIAVAVVACFFNFLVRAMQQLLFYTLIMFSGIRSLPLPLAADGQLGCLLAQPGFGAGEWVIE